MAKRSMVVGQNGRISFDYDMHIADPFNAQSATGADDAAAKAPDMWPAFEALGGAPLLLVRGELSSILSLETAGRMQACVPQMEIATVPMTGHAPTLDEPVVLEALDRMLAKVT